MRDTGSSFIPNWRRLLRFLFALVLKFLSKKPEPNLEPTNLRNAETSGVLEIRIPERAETAEILVREIADTIPVTDSARDDQQSAEIIFHESDRHFVTELNHPYFRFVDEDDEIGHYFNEAWRTPLLTAEEEISLAKRMECGLASRERLENHRDILSSEVISELEDGIEGGSEAREHFILANLRLVIHNARKYKDRGLPFLDLIQAGSVGLMRAAKKFDYRLGNRFSTYATWWIRQAISRAIADQGHVLRLPVHLQDQFSKHRILLTEYLIEQNMPISLEDFAPLDDINLKNFIPLLTIAMPPLDIDKSLGEEAGNHHRDAGFGMDSEDIFQQDDFMFLADMLDPFGRYITRWPQIRTKLMESAGLSNGSEVGLGDIIIDEEVDLEKDTETQLMRRDLQSALRNLPEREANILRMRFGLNGANQEYTLEELGERLGLSRERVRQIEKQALNRLANSQHADSLCLYLDA